MAFSRKCRELQQSPRPNRSPEVGEASCCLGWLQAFIRSSVTTRLPHFQTWHGFLNGSGEREQKIIRGFPSQCWRLGGWNGAPTPQGGSDPPAPSSSIAWKPPIPNSLCSISPSPSENSSRAGRQRRQKLRRALRFGVSPSEPLYNEGSDFHGIRPFESALQLCASAWLWL